MERYDFGLFAQLNSYLLLSFFVFPSFPYVVSPFLAGPFLKTTVLSCFLRSGHPLNTRSSTHFQYEQVLVLTIFDTQQHQRSHKSHSFRPSSQTSWKARPS